MSAASRPPSCVPTWHGHVETTMDALVIFQACFDGLLQHCSRRPHDRERGSLIVSGNVFVYEEQTSGIKRWTDGIPWSPSRILTNFLIYRQLNSPFPPGEKKRATKRNARSTKSGEGYSTPTSNSATPTVDEPRSFPPPQAPESPLMRKENDESPEKDSNRGLVGSLVDSYEFKEGGLLKKTMTVTVNHVSHHLVSYYNLEDAKINLKTPRSDPRLNKIVPIEELKRQPKFKFPNLDDAGDGAFEQQEAAHGQYPGYHYAGSGYSNYQYHGGAVPYNYPSYTSGHHQHPQAGTGYSVPPSGAYPPTQSQYGQSHHSQYPYYPSQGHHQNYQSSYPQHYQGHQPHLQTGQSMAPVKQEPAPTSGPGYSYNVPASHQQPVNSVYGSHQGNGSTAATDGDSVVPASTQPPPAQNWPPQSYNHQWGGSAPRQEGQAYPAPYRQPG